jgi:predicted permease
MARLRPGISEQQALSATDLCFQEINREQLQEFPDSFPSNVLERRIQLLPGNKGLSELRRQFSQPLLILMTVVGLVLLIACANVANLLLARASARQRDMAVRLALGAGRVRLARQLLTESILLSGMGGLLGLVFSFWGIDVLSSLLPQGLTAVALELHPDLRVLGFTLGISLLTGMLFGSAPATQSTRPELVAALKNERLSLGRGARRFELRKVLMVSQVALSLILLIGAGLFVGTLENLQKLDLGFNAENVLLLSMDPSSNGYGEDQVTSFYAQLLQQVSALSGVLSASLASNGLISGETDTFSVEDNPQRTGEKRPTHVSHVDPKFFKTMGISMILGRDFQLQDHERAPKVVIINERVARDFFGKQNPIGRRVGVGHSPPDSEIIGVVRDGRYLNPRQETPRTAYLPFRQFHLGSQTTIAARTLLVRTTGDPKSLIAAVRHEVQALDEDLPIYNVMTLAEQVNELLVQERLIATLSSFFSLLALLLVCMGLYGIMSYAVVRRTNEIGIRMALGARRGDVLWMVMRETLALVIIGVAIGLAASLGVARLISSLLFGLTATDPMTIAVATLMLVAMAALAGYLPARRASRVDPLVALRYE